MSAVAFIPARSGSKRFPHKNIALWAAGRNLTEQAVWMGMEAKRIGLVQDVVISSDDANIRLSGTRLGATPHVRSDALASDNARLVEVLADWLEQLEDRPTFVCLLIPTAPLRTLKHLVESRLLLHTEPGAELVMSLVPWDHSPQWAVRVEDDRVRLAFAADWQTTKPERLFRHDGSVVWFRSSRFLRFGCKEFYGAGVVPYFIDPAESVDVDSEVHLELAKLMYARREARR